MSAVAPNKQTNKQTNICVFLTVVTENTEHLSFPTAHDFSVHENDQLVKVWGKSHFCCSKRLKVLCYVLALLSHEDATESLSYPTELESLTLTSSIKISVGCWMHM